MSGVLKDKKGDQCGWRRERERVIGEEIGKRKGRGGGSSWGCVFPRNLDGMGEILGFSSRGTV